jgi:spore coat protein A
LPGEVTRVIAKFDRPGRYVWHCHILSHEDHEMMRPYHVGPMPKSQGHSLASTNIDRSNDGSAPKAVVLGQNQPNPFSTSTEFRFALTAEGQVELSVYNLAGQKVRTITNSVYGAGEHVVGWDGKDALGNSVSSGVYFYKLNAGVSTQVKKMVLLR